MAIDDKLIVVIGAGAAGLAATQEFIQQGQPVRLLEADSRYGGRIKTVDMGGDTALDSGAAYIHSKSLMLYAQARAQGLLQQHYPARCFDGHRLIPMWWFALYHGLPNIWRVIRLFKLFYQEKQATATLDDLFQKVKLSKVFDDLLRATLCSSLAVGLDKVGVVSLRETFSKADMRPERDIGQFALKQSMHDLLSVMFKDAIGICELSKHVVKINYAESPIIETRDGERIEAKQVVLTVPLAMLKTQTIQFQPALPASKQSAINQLGMGQGARIFFKLNKSFWRAGTKQIIHCDLPLHLTIHADQPALLSAFYISRDGEPIEDDELYQLCIQAFVTLFGKHAIENMTLIHIENWSSNTLIGGAYSFDSPTSIGARSELAMPLSNRLFFAGEATVEGHFGTVDGAMLSGQKAAKEVMLVRNENRMT